MFFCGKGWLLTRLFNAGRRSLASFRGVDLQAILLVLIAMSVALIVFFALPADTARLTRFAPEQVAAFSIADSSPQRRALIVYLGLLVAGAVGLRFLRLAMPRPGIPWPLVAVLVGLMLLQGLALARLLHGAMSLPPVSGVTTVAILAGYALAALAFVWHRSLHSGLLVILVVIGALLSWWPLQGGAMHNIPTLRMPWVDQHLTAVFSGGDMLASGFRFFTEVPANYGILTPLGLATTIKSGITIDLLWLVHLTEVFQALTLLFFLAAAWSHSADGSRRGRLGVMLLMMLVTYPFLSMASQAVLLPNQSGYRFVMFPLAALVLAAMPRLLLRAASALAGAMIGLALLHNVETGVAVTGGLGLAWLLLARSARAPVAVSGLLLGVAMALAMLIIPVALHLAAMGFMPPLDMGAGMSLFLRFGEGFGGLAPPIRAAVLFIFAHAGYVVVRALAHSLGRAGDEPAPASAGIAAMIIAWTPYYANRPDDWNFWSYLALYVLLLAPLIVAGLSRVVLAGIALLVLVPNSLTAALNDNLHLREAAGMPVVRGCGAGLSLALDACAEQLARAAELRSAAANGNTVWITGYPYLTWQLTRLRPLIPPLDLYATAISEDDVAKLAARIGAARPRAIFIDGIAGSVIGEAVPLPMRMLHRRIAMAAGYHRCAAAGLHFWEDWRPAGACPADVEDDGHRLSDKGTY